MPKGAVIISVSSLGSLGRPRWKADGRNQTGFAPIPQALFAPVGVSAQGLQ